MKQRKIRKPQPEILRQIRNNVRKGNYSRVAQLAIGVLNKEDSDENRNDLIEIIYSDCMAPWVEREDKEEPVPRQYENMFLEYARYDINHENPERALEILKSIEESKNPKIIKKVRRQINIINLSQETSKGDSANLDVVDGMIEEIKKDPDAIKYVEEIIHSNFGEEFSAENLNVEYLKKYMSEKHRKPSDINNVNNDVISTKGSYPEELKVENRLKFFKEELDIEPIIRFCDNGIFAGSILLELKDTDLILVEKIIDMYADGTYELNNYGSSTYILPKDKMLDLIKLQTRGKVKEQLRGDEIRGIAPIQHRENWKRNILDVVEKRKNELREKPEVESEQVQDENDETIEQTPVVFPEKFKSKTKIRDNIIANKEFVQNINASLDGILTNEMIEQITKRTGSYSFEHIFNNRLKEKILGCFETLEMPEEKREAESRKVFLVMKMTQENMSILNSKKGLSEEGLDYLIEQYSCYYDYALAALKKGVEQGLSYKQIVEEMRNCIIIEEEKLTKTENAPENIEDNTDREEENQSEVSSDTEQTTPGVERLLEDIAQNGNSNPIFMEAAKKLKDLLGRINELDAEQLKLDKNLKDIIREEEEARKQAEERIKAQEVAKEKLAEAIKEEKEASALAEQAISAEKEIAKRKQEFEERQKALDDEKASIQEKLEMFKEL